MQCELADADWCREWKVHFTIGHIALGHVAFDETEFLRLNHFFDNDTHVSLLLFTG